MKCSIKDLKSKINNKLGFATALQTLFKLMAERMQINIILALLLDHYNAKNRSLHLDDLWHQQ